MLEPLPRELGDDSAEHTLEIPSLPVGHSVDETLGDVGADGSGSTRDAATPGGQTHPDLSPIPQLDALQQPGIHQSGRHADGTAVAQSQHARDVADAGAVEELVERDHGGDTALGETGRGGHGSTLLVREAGGRDGEQVRQPVAHTVKCIDGSSATVPNCMTDSHKGESG